LFSANLGNEDEDKVSVISDLESILTFYCKSKSLKYEKGNGWIELLLPLIALKLPRSGTYNLFEAIKNFYIPRFVRVFHCYQHLYMTFRLVSSIIQLIPWNRVLFEKLILAELGKKFSPFYGTKKFITLLTTVCICIISGVR